MAKAKKKEALSLDEKLEQALVPLDEQPYEVPGNWCWTYLRNIAQWGSGGTPSRKNPTFYEGDIPWVKTGELEDDYLYDTEEKISDEAIQKSSAKLFPIESVLIAMYGATIGKTAILGVEATTNQACACAICNESVYNKYLFYYLRSQKDNFIEQGKGGAQPNISQDIIKKNYIPLPPLAEQKRIVEQIESLFAKLDEASEKLLAVIDGLEIGKQAVLYRAFNGSLTKNWRRLNNVSDEIWSPVPLTEMFNLKSGSTIAEEDEQATGLIPYLKVADMNLDENLIQITTSTRFVNECSESHIIPKGSTIFPKRGGAILTNKKRYVSVEKIIADLNVMAIIPKEKKAIGWFGYYLMQSIDLRQLNNGSSVPQINNKDMIKLSLGCPSIEEQEELVKILRGYFDKYYIVLDTVNSSLEQIELMKKSILAKAFRGELGTNHPDEESAVELLKFILETE